MQAAAANFMAGQAASAGVGRGGSSAVPPANLKIRTAAGCEQTPKPKVQNSSALCLQFIYIHPLTLQGGGGKLLLALAEKEC